MGLRKVCMWNRKIVDMELRKVLIWNRMIVSSYGTEKSVDVDQSDFEHGAEKEKERERTRN